MRTPAAGAYLHVGMLRRHLLPLPLLAALAAAPAVAAPPAAMLEPETAAISPDGQAVAYVTTSGRTPAVLVRDFASGRFLLRAELASEPRRLQWAGEGRLLILTAAPGGRTVAFILDISHRRLTRLMRDTPRSPQTIVGAPAVRTAGGRVALYLQAAVAPGRRFVSLVRADLDPLSARLAAAGENVTRGWTVDSNGEPAAVELYDAATHRWTLRVRAEGGWRQAHSAVGSADSFRLLGLARDGQAVLYAIREPGLGWVWREARLDDAASADPLALGEVADPIHDPQDGRVIGYVRGGSEAQYVFFDPSDAAAWKAVAGAFPRDRVQFVGWSADRRRVLALVDSVQDGPAYAQVDLATRVASWIGPVTAARRQASAPAARRAN